jgi:putative protease
MADRPLGKVTHYFDKISVAVVKLEPKAVLKKGEKIRFEGHGAEFEQEVDSLQIDHEEVASAKAGDSFGLKVNEAVKEGTQVFKA